MKAVLQRDESGDSAPGDPEEMGEGKTLGRKDSPRYSVSGSQAPVRRLEGRILQDAGCQEARP